MEKPSAPVVIVAGMSHKNHVIGKENGLLWHVPEDMKRFKRLTLGHPVIMGRKTFESIIAILGKPLPGRTNIVVTRNPDYQYEGAETAGSLEEAFVIAERESPQEIHIGGGEEMYRQAMPYVKRLHLTYYFDEKEGDAHFPDFADQFEIVEEHPIQEHNGLEYQWIDYTRKNIEAGR